MIAACETCRKYEVSQQKESLMPVETPPRPWEKIGVDLFSFDSKDFLSTVNYFSNYWEIDKLNNTLATTVVLKLKSHFARFGCPDQVIGDNGPQFDSEVFRKFSRTWEFEHLTSSPGDTRLSQHADSRNGLQSSSKANESSDEDAVADNQVVTPTESDVPRKSSSTAREA